MVFIYWLLLSLPLALTTDLEWFDYGHYCGLGYTSPLYIKPIDRVDRLCQIHDICVSVGLMDCYCNQQLLYRLVNLEPSLSNPAEANARHLYINLMYQANNWLCHQNYYGFDHYYVLPSRQVGAYAFSIFYREDWDVRAGYEPYLELTVSQANSPANFYYQSASNQQQVKELLAQAQAQNWTAWSANDGQLNLTLSQDVLLIANPHSQGLLDLDLKAKPQHPLRVKVDQLQQDLYFSYVAVVSLTGLALVLMGWLGCLACLVLIKTKKSL